MKFIKTFEGYSEKEEESIQKDIDSGKLVLIEPSDENYDDAMEFLKILKQKDSSMSSTKRLNEISERISKNGRECSITTHNGKNYWMMKSDEKLEEDKNYEQIREFTIACKDGDFDTIKRMANTYLITVRNCMSLLAATEKGRVDIVNYILTNYLDDIIQKQIERERIKSKKDLFNKLRHWVETSDKLDNKDEMISLLDSYDK